MGTWFWRNVYIPGLKRYDGTAMSVAKVRMTETMLPAEKRLFHDPYAKNFIIGASIMERMGPETIVQKFDDSFPGMYSMLAGRTRYLDDLCSEAERAGCEQLLILGAGYDTRGVRLGLKIPCFEVDRPEVHALKKAGLDDLDLTDEQRARVHHVAVDFNKESVRKVGENPHFKKGARTIVLLEGVSQYIPKESTAETLAQVQALVGTGSVLGISYVNEALFDDNAEILEKEIGIDHAAVSKVLRDVSAIGEPWISGWSKGAFESFLQEHSFQVTEDITISDLEDRYFKPAGKTAVPFLQAEHFVKAKRI